MKKEARKAPEARFILESWEITRAHEFDGGNISYDLRVNGVTIYGMSLIWDGEKKEYWSAFPSRKGKDGKYYKIAWFPISEELQINIVKRIEEVLS